MSDWESIEFGGLYKEPSKNGLMAPSKVRGSGALLVNMREIFAFDRIFDQHMERAPIPERNFQSWLLREDDLLFARQSLTLAGAGKVSLMLAPSEPMTFESHLIRVRLDSERADARFYYYLFRSAVGRSLVEGIVEQVAAAGIRASDLGRLRVPYPDVEEQRRIGAILGALDDLIETNQRVARLQQELMQQLFRRCFSGLAPFGGARAARWRQGRLADLLQLIKRPIKGGTRTDIPYVPIDSIPMHSIGLEGARPNDEARSSLTLFDKNDVLLGAMRVYFHRVAIAPFEGITRSTVFVLRARDPEFLPYALFLINEEDTIAFANASSQGSTMPYAVWDGGLAEMPIDIPSLEDVQRFNIQVWPLLEQVRDGLQEVEVLTRARDELLPLLMSGRVRVSDYLGVA